MNIEVIETLPRLDGLREDWLRLYADDAAASVFMTWWWLRAWVEVSPYPWTVLVAREAASDAVAGILPISLRGIDAPFRVDQPREVHFAGDPAADYRGMLCDPGHEASACEAFAEHLVHRVTWDRIIFADVFDPRIHMLAEMVARRAGMLELHTRAGNASPFLPLPDTWEQYLRERLTPASRKSLKKRLRLAALQHADLRCASQSPAELSVHLDALMRLASTRDRLDAGDLARVRHVLESCVAGGCGEVFVLSIDDKPAAAQGAFLDRRARTICHYLAGFDPRFAALSPGRVLDALCIRQAIEQGWSAIDFLRGDEPYKRQLGGRPRCTQHLTITRQTAAARVRLSLERMRRRLGI